jgi:hypothetical protein
VFLNKSNTTRTERTHIHQLCLSILIPIHPIHHASLIPAALESNIHGMHLHLRIDSDLVLTRIPIPGRAVLLLPHGDERLEARNRGGEDAVAELELRADVDVRGCEVSVGDQDGRGEVVEAEDYGGEESGRVRIAKARIRGKRVGTYRIRQPNAPTTSALAFQDIGTSLTIKKDTSISAISVMMSIAPMIPQRASYRRRLAWALRVERARTADCLTKFEHCESHVAHGWPTWQRMDRSMIDRTAQKAHAPRIAQTAKECARIWLRRRYRKAMEAFEQNDTRM